MSNFIFITGAGRCGTNLMLSLLDGNKKINIFPGEVTNLIFRSLNNDSVNGKVYRKNLVIFFQIVFKELKVNNFPNYSKKIKIIKKLITKKFKKKKHLDIKTLLNLVIRNLFDKKNKTILNLQDENILKLLEIFPKCKVVHMIRNPLSQINSRYLFRYKSPNNFDGSEFGKSFYRNYNSFKNAYLLYKDKRVLTIKIEDLTQKKNLEIKRVFKFLKIKPSKINFSPTLYGKNLNKNYNFNVSSKITKISEDYSCLTKNDQYVVSQIKYANNFYKIKKKNKKKNNFLVFFLRHIGLIGKKRLKTINLFKILKLSIFSIYLYFLDNYYKQKFLKYENI